MTVPKVEKEESGKRSYSKKLYCFKCDRLYTYRLGNHFASVHANDPEIARALSKTGKEKQHWIQFFINIGSFKYNTRVLGEEKGELIVARRSATVKDAYEYLPCPFCYGFMKSDELWRHCRKCFFSPDLEGKDESNLTRRYIAKARILLEGAVATIPDITNNHYAVINKELIAYMRKDHIFKYASKDQLIATLGKILYFKLGVARRYDIIQRMRQLARLKIALNILPSTQLSSFLCGKRYDDIIKAVYEMCGLQSSQIGRHMLQVPSLALRMGHLLTKCGEIKKGIAVREDDDVNLKEADNFLSIHKSEWADRVSSIALATLRRKRFEKPQALPLTSDLVKLKEYLDARISTLTAALHQSPCYNSWRSLAEVTLAKLTLFNKRRSGEPAQLLKTSYAERPCWAELANHEAIRTLNEAELKLMKR